MLTTKLDAATLRSAFSHVPAGVVAVCGRDGASRIGMAASTFVPVSLDPPLVAFCVQRTSETWKRLEMLPRLGISVLAEDQGSIARRLAAKVDDRFADVETHDSSTGTLFVAGSTVRFEVTIAEQIPAGDHLIVLFAVDALDVGAHSGPAHIDGAETEPIIFHKSMFRSIGAA
ncbi:flavin reductase family protein (plasmid) [Rhodococcus rhodochrous]|uniref:flavin reductase family protein n=1 Tax=Rhodococcus rhodochrous TaxID=1829 RepID=UPI00132E8F8A|nr:flavin reductase family protein [Rhodococcus rhodochrous]QHG85536.1 flavin reductase family protein [Rhodococcus rhodochrous]